MVHALFCLPVSGRSQSPAIGYVGEKCLLCFSSLWRAENEMKQERIDLLV